MGNPFLDATTVVLARTTAGETEAATAREGTGGTGPSRRETYDATLDESWNLFPLPQGGIVTAIALRAMATHLDDPTQHLRTMHTTFVGRVAHGHLSVEVELLRRGRSVSQLRAEVKDAGADHGHVTTAVFGSTREGFDFTDLEPPVVPPPLECPSYRDPRPDDFEGFEPSAFWERRMEGRAALGHAPWEDYVPDRAEQATWYRLDDPPLRDDGTLDPFALVVMADTMPGAVGQRLGPGTRAWFAPSADLTFHLLGECRSQWVLAHNRARFAGDGYASADMALWAGADSGTQELELVGYATQLFLFTFL